MRIGDNPTEREVFLQCPKCKLDVFDSGLSNDLVCKKCSYELSSGKKKDKKAETQSQTSSNKLVSGEKQSFKKSEKRLSERRESDDAGGSMPKTPSEDKLSNPEISSFDPDLEDENEEGKVARTLF